MWNALQHLKQGPVATQDRIIVHDAARCMLSARLLSKILDEIESSQALSVGLPVIDTIKKVDSGVIVGSLPRNALWAMQTPQAFLFSLIFQAHQEAAKNGDFSATDDVSLVEARTSVKVIEGERRNIKITCAEDLKAAEALL